jgi:hypothetical protein
MNDPININLPFDSKLAMEIKLVPLGSHVAALGELKARTIVMDDQQPIWMGSNFIIHSSFFL